MGRCHSAIGIGICRRERGGGARVVLRCEDGGFLSLRFGNDLFDVLVPSLRWLPVGISEGLG